MARYALRDEGVDNEEEVFSRARYCAASQILVSVGSCEFLWSASAYDVSTMCSCGGRVYDTETQEIETGHAHP